MPRASRPRAVVKARDALPEWYKLDNYGIAERFSLEQWFSALYVRQTVWQLYKYRATRGGVYPTYWEEIKRTGAAAFSNNKGWAAHVGSDAVRSLPVIDLFEIRDSIAREGAYLKHYKKFNRDLDKSSAGGPGVSPHPKLGETVREALDPETYWMHNAAFLVIDLDATNETLTKRFGSWLEQVRAREKDHFRTRRYSAKDSKAWFDSGLLQFIDLSQTGRSVGRVSFRKAAKGADRHRRRMSAPIRSRLLHVRERTRPTRLCGT